MSVVLTGNFDGVHIGHADLVRAAKKMADLRGEPLYIYTFNNNPKNFLDPAHAVASVMSLSDRDRLLYDLGADRIVSVDFDKAFADMTADEYLDMLVSELDCTCVVCGENFCFGRGGLCNAHNIGLYASAHGLAHTVVPLTRLPDGRAVSSTAVRRSVADADMGTACAMLGRYFYMKGRVVHGRHEGTSFGYPTINIAPDTSLVVPGRGVYETVTVVGGCLWRSMTNIGTAPTVSSAGRTMAETNLLCAVDGSDVGDLNAYGCPATVSFVRYLRPETRFSGVDELVAQLARDRASVLASDAPNYDKVVRF